MAFLPVSKKDLIDKGIDSLDFIMISADAYVDHPSFGHAVIARFIESQGFSVGIIPQPQSDADFKSLGVPNVAFLVSGGVVDSMVNNYTVAKNRRTVDSYSPAGKMGLRPDRATTVYSQRLRKIFGEDVVIVLGGIEASLRRFAHYDYWSDKVMPSILVDSFADLIVYGMGEKPFYDILQMVKKGIPIKKIKNIRGTCYLSTFNNLSKAMKDVIQSGGDNEYIILNSFDEVSMDKRDFAESFRIQSRNTDAINGRGLIQMQTDNKYLVQNVPAFAMSEEELDAVFALPFEKDYHPMYKSMGGVPAIEEVKFSIISHRGCFGSCSYCALNYHQGRTIQKRSENSIIEEAEQMAKNAEFKGYIHDVGGPTANFRNIACKHQKESGVCQNKYCIGNKPCKNLVVDHSEYLSLLQKIRKIPNIKKVFIRSGIRFDYLMMDKNPQFFNELVKYHISGQLKIAPEHISNKVLNVMNKPHCDVYKNFAVEYKRINDKNKLNQFLVPYFISSHPSSTLNDAIDLACYLKSINYMPMQVQDFYPTPSTRSTCMFYAGIDPDTMQEVYVPKSKEEKAMQRALLQYRKKENYMLIKKALILAKREDLIGYDEKCLIKPLRVNGQTISTLGQYSKRPYSKNKNEKSKTGENDKNSFESQNKNYQNNVKSDKFKDKFDDRKKSLSKANARAGERLNSGAQTKTIRNEKNKHKK